MLRFGPFEVDFSASELRKSGSLVRIQEQPLRLLKALLEQPGELVTRERLRERLWPSDTFVDFERSLNAAVAKLRQALNDSADQPLYVETVSGKGYRFIAPVSQTASKPEETTLAPERPAPSRRAVLLAATAIVFASAVILAWVTLQRQEATQRLTRDTGSMRFTVAMPQGTQMADAPYVPNVAISPDGRTLALVVAPLGGGPSSIWIRPLASEAARRLEGTEGATLPFWSPDGGAIGFFADGQIKRIDIKRIDASGGPVRVLCGSIGFAGGASWSTGGVILYSAGGPLYTVNAAGGPCKQLTRLDEPGEFRHVWPQFLTDGRRFLYFTATKDITKNATYVSSLDSVRRELVLTNRTRGGFAPPDKLLFVRDGILFAQKWDFRRNQTRDQAVALAANVNAFTIGVSAFSISANGVLAYRSGANLERQIVCYGRDGKRLRNIGVSGAYNQFALSPDEKTAALTVSVPPGQVTGLRIWLLRLDTEVISRYDFGNVANAFPVWSPDSRRIVFASFEVAGLKTELLEWTIGEERPKLLLADERQNIPEDWSSDDRFLLYGRDSRLAMSVAVEPGAKPVASGDRDFMKYQLRLSPDRARVAYNADRAGRQEVFVAAFPSFTETVQVSADGGGQPLWSRDGNELFYLAPDRNLMSVAIRAGVPIDVSAPRVLFRTSLVGGVGEYAISRDRQRVYLIEPVASQQDSLHVITRWDGEGGG
ncbi:MAG TPA: winged helix-turn-helix domain-containing protein [Bryobacteraceae bacterium]|nr:winged helix-turn-helix domain-containing protein [Bryobacteraceae bacterium]